MPERMWLVTTRKYMTPQQAIDCIDESNRFTPSSFLAFADEQGLKRYTQEGKPVFWEDEIQEFARYWRREKARKVLEAQVDEDLPVEADERLVLGLNSIRFKRTVFALLTAYSNAGALFSPRCGTMFNVISKKALEPEDFGSTGLAWIKAAESVASILSPDIAKKMGDQVDFQAEHGSRLFGKDPEVASSTLCSFEWAATFLINAWHDDKEEFERQDIERLIQVLNLVGWAIIGDFCFRLVQIVFIDFTLIGEQTQADIDRALEKIKSASESPEWDLASAMMKDLSEVHMTLTRTLACMPHG